MAFTPPSSRFTFTQKFGSTVTDTDYNSVVTDFNNFISTGLTKDNVENQSIRFRHLTRPTTRLLWKDCSGTIWEDTAKQLQFKGRTPTAGSDFGDWDHYDTVSSGTPECALLYNFASSDSLESTDLLEFTIWYYPYSICADSEVAPAFRRKSTGVWTRMTSDIRKAGMAIGFYTSTEQTPYDHNPYYKPFNPFLRQAGSGDLARSGVSTGGNSGVVAARDRLGTIGYGGPIICNVIIPKSGPSGLGIPLSDIDAFGMMIRHNISQDVSNTFADSVKGVHISMCCRYDRLYLSLVTRGH